VSSNHQQYREQRALEGVNVTTIIHQWAREKLTDDISVTLTQTGTEVILTVKNCQGYASVVLEPDRDLPVLVEAVRALIGKVIYPKKRSKGAPKKSR
jgi:hypothetical protein